MQEISIQNALRSAEQHLGAGRFSEAENLCNQILQQQPNNPQALNLLCILARKQGHIAAAIEIATRAVKAHPNIPEFHANLGEFSRLAGQLHQSIASFQRAIALRPAEPTFHNSLATVLLESRQYESAVAEYDRAIHLKPDYADARSNLGGALRELGRLNEAATSITAALRLQPNSVQAHLNLALVLTDQEKFAEAAESYRRAIAIQPDFTQAHWSLGTIYLLLGEMEQGWQEYQWRIITTHRFSKPLWNGQDLKGKTILLHVEQGLGDTIQFVRYIPILIARGAQVFLACQAELARLFTGFSLVLPSHPLPPHDFQSPLLSLPMVLGTNLQNIPAQVPYLFARPEQSKNWLPRLARKNSRLRVGLVWAGSPHHRDDARRSLRFDQLLPILNVPDVEFLSLQKGPAVKQAKNSPITDFTTELQDFSDTAALIEHLDLVITVDTSVAHLAAAMGKPTWVLLARVPDWRWLLQRTDSPWYPTIRLFRQQKLNQWDEPIHEVSQALSAFDPARPPV